MTLHERLREELIAAMRAKDVLRRDVFRMVEAAIYAVEKRDHRVLSDDEVVGILTHEVKTRRESIEAFRAGGREDLAAKEEAEIAILADFLPRQLTEDELRALVDETIAEAGATSVKDLGRVMGRLSPKTRGRADGKRASELVAQALARRQPDAHDAAAPRGGS